MIIQNCNVNKLHDEFVKVGIKPFPVLILENGDGDFTFTDDTDMELVHRIIDAHDPIPLPPKPTTEQLVSQQKDLAIKLIVPTLPDEALIQVPLLVDEWAVGADYVAHKSVVRHGDDLFRVITSHKSQADWTPDIALTLFSRISRPGEILAWKQGSYTKGTKVTHKGFTWESVVDNNVWEPGVVDETIWKKIV